MVNFRVRDLDAMTAQLRAAGIQVKIDATEYPNGRFGAYTIRRATPSSYGSPRAETLKPKIGHGQPFPLPTRRSRAHLSR